MPLPNFNASGDLPAGVHRATLNQVIQHREIGEIGDGFRFFSAFGSGEKMERKEIVIAKAGGLVIAVENGRGVYR